MPFQHSPPARKTRSQARAQEVLTQTPRAPLVGIPEVPQVGDQICKEKHHPGRKEGSQEDQQMTQIMAIPHKASSSEASRPSMKSQDCLDGTQPFKVRSLIKSCQLIFHNYQEKSSEGRKKVLYATSFLISMALKWIEPYLSNFTNKDPAYLLNNLALFESQLFTLFGDPNEVRKAEAELNSLIMKEGGHLVLYISYFRIIVSQIRNWGERPFIHHFRKGLGSRILDQLAFHPSKNDSLQDSMDITLELYTRYHERKKQKSHLK
ncbi:hypothetical protein O181_033382 [Austropuccinia psidii MF-1]|uniref:Retrotransposon gag domain-containing protein n=1 Tax=Austropuccinia psidii MF-1 TaxID=1389203 RepID=A0A9Q3D4I2_9BASI|nr:hypothetical protein [Austropuccinia psidii MF-1]